MYRVVLLRHGESTWNRENRFTGWTDVDLSEQGVAEAHEAARLLREGGYDAARRFVERVDELVGSPAKPKRRAPRRRG